MSADIPAIARQISDLILTGAGKDLREENYNGARGAMISLLHQAIAHAGSLAHALAELDRTRAFCGCGNVATGVDLTGARMCDSCRRLAEEAGRKLDLIAEPGVWDDPAVQRAVREVTQ